LYTGFQYDPVLSIAAIVQFDCTNQSINSSSSAVVVPKVRFSRERSRFGSEVRIQAVTLFLWTSNPQQQEWINFITIAGKR
jgi:hypothetical protein